MTESAPTLEDAQRLRTDRFVLQRCLGQGATGVVYSAIDRLNGAKVALKTLLHMSPMGISRLKHEFRALTSLSHPNFVALHELICTGGVWFITMELVDGVDFVSHARQNPAARPLAGPTATPPLQPRNDSDRLRQTLTQLADAIAALHEAGRVHLDIKPSNVLVDRAGRVVLLDFELAREREQRAAEEMFEGGSLIGTPAFVSPEVVLGRPPSPASDWYAFGTLLYEALGGEPPFRGEPSRMLIRKCTTDPVPPREADPSIPEDLSELCMDLLARDPRGRPLGGEVLRRLGARPARWSVPSLVTSMSPPPPRLVGRDEQLTELSRQFERCRQGSAVTTYITGRSGLGKTALTQAFLERLRHGGEALIFTGRCYERESVPFKAFDAVVDALTRYMARLPESEVAALLPTDHPALARMFPVFETVEAVRRTSVSASPDVQELRRRAFEALRELLHQLALRQPVVLWIDDLQWGDRDSALLLSSILRPPHPPRLMFIGSFRVEDHKSEFLETYEGAQVDVAASTLTLRPLSGDDALILAQALLGGASANADRQAALIASECEGNPFFLTELARDFDNDGGESRAVRADGELTLERVILGRIARLPPASQAVMEIVSVAGSPIEQQVAIEAAGLRFEDSAAVATLRVAHLVRSYRGGEVELVRAYHDRISETIVAHLDPEKLRDRHRRLADALERSGHADSETLVIHHRGAGQLDRAGEHAARAGDQASRSLAFDQAARLYRLALELSAPKGTEREDLAIKLGDALANAGRGQEAARVYLDTAPTASSYVALELTRRAGEQLLRNGHIDDGLAAIGSVLDQLEIRRAKTPGLALAYLLWRRLTTRTRGLGFVERDESEVAKADLTRIDVCWSATVVTGMVDTIRGAEMQARHLPLALRTGEPYRVCRALCIEAVHVASEGQARRSSFLELTRMADKLAQRVRHPHAIGLTELACGMGSWVFGEWQNTVDICQRADRLLREGCRGVAWEIGTAQICTARALIMLGHVDKLADLAARTVQQARDRGDRYSAWAGVAGWPILGKIALGAAASARDELREVYADWSRANYSVQDHWACLGEAYLDLNEGRAAEAFARLDHDEPAHKSSQLFRVQIIRIDVRFLQATAALAARKRGDKSLLSRAETIARKLAEERVHWSIPLSDLVRAGVSRLRGDEEGAVALLNRAIEGFNGAEMWLLAALARRRLGEMRQGDEGHQLRERAEAFLKGEGVTDIDALARTLTPAFER